MGFSVDLTKSRTEQNISKPVQERVLLPSANRAPQHQNRSKTPNLLDRLQSSYQPRELTKEAGKHSGYTVEDGELVKHMTNLPGYLKRIEKAENSQGKILNVGVLDWTRLEQWKHKQKNVLDRGISTASSSSSRSLLTKSSGSSKSSSLGHTSKTSERHSLPRSNPVPSRKKDVSSSIEGSVSDAVDFASPSSSDVPGHRRSFSGKLAETEKIKGMHRKIPSEIGQVPLEYKPVSTSLPPRKTCTGNTSLGQKVSLEKEATSSKLADFDASPGSVTKNSARSVRTRKVHELEQSNPDPADQSLPEPGSRIVLLLPKDSSQIQGHRESFDKYRTGSRKCSFSDNVSTEDVNFLKSVTDIPHSCPLPSSVETNVASPLEKTQVHHSECEYVEMVNQEDAEPRGTRSRNPSPNRRFSFSLSRMGRSLSFKEDSVAKSCPLTSDPSNSVEQNPNKETVKGHSRARSSPLRRLLDPILKPKEPNPPKGHFSPFSSGPVYSFPNENVSESRVQALLQWKVSNGIPLFKFVVDDDNSILAATMKNLGPSDKDDSGRSYTFYLVNEVKKKSGNWMTGQGNKAKNGGYAYNVIAQMKVSDRRESVLFAVERKAGSPEFVPNRELAAAVPATRYSKGVTVILPGAVHSAPSKGEPSPLIERWRSGGVCDCGGWDVGCKIQVLSDRGKFPKVSKSLDRYELFVQGAEREKGAIFSLAASKEGIYSVEYNTSVSRLQAFFICVAVLTGGQRPARPSFEGNDSESEPPGLPVKLPAKYTAPYPPLSPVGRV